jgi:hypothetical protein
MRDEFSNQVKELLAKRVGYRCSNPDCRQLTSGPQAESTGSINVGVAAHITSASIGGPRYKESLTPEQRKAAENGIWLCQKCAKLVDSDLIGYTIEKLNGWKHMAEIVARNEIEGRSGCAMETREKIFCRIEAGMPDLLTEMREDLAKYPLRREFVLLKKNWAYWPKGAELVYYY